MKSKIVHLLKDILTWENKSGEIRLILDLPTVTEISFCINAEKVSVKWGDGQESGRLAQNGWFRHLYEKAGIHHVIIEGEQIIDVDVRNCYITSLEVNKCSTLEYLDCSDNLLRKLDVSGCKRLYELYCNKNQLEELSLKEYDKLFSLSCSHNYLKNIALEGCRNLVNFNCCRNNLMSLDVSYCRKLSSVNLDWNLLDSKALNYFLTSLTSRSKEDVGFILFRNNAGNYACDRSILNRKWWNEI